MNKNANLMGLILSLFLIIQAGSARTAEPFVISGQVSEEALIIKPLLRTAYKAIGVYPIFEYYRGTRSLNLVNRGENDAEIARVMGVNVKYQNLIRVDVPVGAIEIVMVVRKDSPSKAVKIQDLPKLRVAYLRGNEYLKKRARGKNSHAVTKNSEILNMVEGRRVDYGFMLAKTAEKLLDRYPNLEVRESPFEPIVVYHYIHKKHIALKPKLELSIRKLVLN